ncbi:MAG: S41 family peptidase [Salinivirgaceae bacterium]
MKKIVVFAIILLIVGLVNLSAQQISDDLKKQTINRIGEELQLSYIDENKAIEMDKVLNELFKDGAYESINNGEDFAFKITNDLRSVSNDLHLSVKYFADAQLQTQQPNEINAEEQKWIDEVLRASNYGIKSKKILEGNIAYLEIPLFGPLELCADTLIAAMQFIAETDALIIDLRNCRGSMDVYTIPFLCAYFFDEPVHLFSFENREKQSLKQFWTAAWVPGNRYTKKPIYVLTSGRTFSGGEELAYDLKHLQRATLVGEVTKGGANPTYPVYLNPHFSISIPKERSINPVTNTNWEQIGVIPDIETESRKALFETHLLALENLMANSATKKSRTKLDSLINQLEKNRPISKKVVFKLNGFKDAKKVMLVGSFNFWDANKSPMTFDGQTWFCEVTVDPGMLSYKFIVDGKYILDPDNPGTIKDGDYLNSVIEVF